MLENMEACNNYGITSTSTVKLTHILYDIWKLLTLFKSKFGYHCYHHHLFVHLSISQAQTQPMVASLSACWGLLMQWFRRIYVAVSRPTLAAKHYLLKILARISIHLRMTHDQWPNICSKIFDRNVIFNQWKWGFSTGRPPQLSSFFCPGTPGPKPPRGVPWRPRELLCRPWGGRKRARRCWVCP